jgi:hypothetical protein
MTDTTLEWKSVISTDCTCEDENGKPDEFCNDYCWIMNGAETSDLLNEWVSRNGETATDTAKVSSTRMNWDGVAGYAVSEVTKLPETLAIRGDYRLSFTLRNNELIIWRYSHDEPTGAYFTVEFVPD